MLGGSADCCCGKILNLWLFKKIKYRYAIICHRCRQDSNLCGHIPMFSDITAVTAATQFWFILHTLAPANWVIRYARLITNHIFYLTHTCEGNIIAVVSEWLRRWTWNPLGYARTGSNPVRSELFFFRNSAIYLIKLTIFHAT